MSRFDTKEFGEAAPFLRKSDLELLALQTMPFDGRPFKETSNKRNLKGHFRLKMLLLEIYFVLETVVNLDK